MPKSSPLLGLPVALLVACSSSPPAPSTQPARNDHPATSASAEVQTVPGQHECAHAAAGGSCDPSAAVPTPVATAGGVTRYGAASDPSIAAASLDDIHASPATFADRSVRTSGVVHRVCQRMGCWMELRSEASDLVVRVPMAGHGFFLPRDAAGKHATVEGRVVMQELTAAQRAHYESEGATHTSAPFALHAASVELQ